MQPQKVASYETIYLEAESSWDLERLYNAFKHVMPKGSQLTSLQKFYVRGILLGKPPREIAQQRGQDFSPNDVSRFLSEKLYRWIKNLIKERPEGNDAWQQVPILLKEYRKQQNWKGVPDCSPFYGRADELNTLRQWLIEEGCRLVILFGAGGVGKTWLSSHFVRQMEHQFSGSWQNLDGSPPLNQILNRLQFQVQQTPQREQNTEGKGIEEGIDWLVDFLSNQYFLLILDGIQEDLLSDQEKWGDYIRLLRRLELTDMKSCVLITSREKLSELRQLGDGKSGKVRSLKISSLELEAAKKMLYDFKLKDQDRWKDLISACSGNPLYLRIVASIISDQFNSKVSRYLKEETIYLGEFKDILQDSWKYLKDSEKDTLKVIAESSRPISSEAIRKYIPEHSSSSVIEIIKDLGNKCLIENVIESDLKLYTIRPDVRKFIIIQNDKNIIN